MLRWFDHHLKGADNGVTKDPTVRYYVMGAAGEKDAPGNEWRTADDWPVKATADAVLPARRRRALREGADRGEVGHRRSAADPLNPATIPGRAFPGAKDARDFEKQAEVRTFTIGRADRAGGVDRQGAGGAVRVVDGEGHRLHRARERRVPGRPLDPAGGLRPPAPLPRGVREGGVHGAGEGVPGELRRGLGRARCSTRGTASASRWRAPARRSTSRTRTPASR